MNKALNLAAVIVARCCDSGVCSLDDSKIRALCSVEGVSFESVKDFIDVSCSGQARDDIRDLALNAVVATSVAKGTDSGDELLKEVTVHYIKYKSALQALTERYKTEYAEEIVRLEGLVNKVSQEI